MENNGNIGRRSAAIQQLRQAQIRPYVFDRTEKFVNYWFSLPKIGLIPLKSGINPRSMLDMLPGVIMLETTDDTEVYRIRLLGTSNVARWGFEATNANFLSFSAPQQQNLLLEIFSQIRQVSCGVILRGDELYTSGRRVKNEMVLLPLRHPTPGHHILIGLISAESDQMTDYGSDILASLFYTVTATHFINIGAGIPD